jgi:hypothetical protein
VQQQLQLAPQQRVLPPLEQRVAPRKQAQN